MSLDRRVFLGGALVSVWSLPAGADPNLLPATVPSAPALAAGKDEFIVLEARPGAIRLRDDPKAETGVWTYGGEVPGPVVRLKRGAELKVRLVNKLTEPTSLCWHGVRAPNAMDGVAGLTQAAVKPGESFEYRFTPPDSGLFWYHPHVWPLSAGQIDRGLYGVLIVDEVAPPPSDEEMLVVLDDWTLDDRGQIKGDFVAVAQAMRQGRIGSLVTANSRPVPVPHAARPGSRIRLRLLSVASARVMIVAFEGAHPMVQAIDGQPCELFEPVRQTIPLGPGSRFDIMIDTPAEAGKAVTIILRGDGEPDQPLLILKTEGEPRKSRDAITVLAQNTSLPAMIPLERAFKINLVIEGGVKLPEPAPKAEIPARTQPPSKTVKAQSAKPVPATVTPSQPAPDPTHLWTINGVASDGFSSKPLFKVKRGSAVSLAFVNKSAFVQQIHVHGHVMRLLHDLDDGWEPYWRDAILIAEGRTKHVAFVADNPGKWAIESLVLDRQVTGLAGWFEVT